MNSKRQTIRFLFNEEDIDKVHFKRFDDEESNNFVNDVLDKLM